MGSQHLSKKVQPAFWRYDRKVIWEKSLTWIWLVSLQGNLLRQHCSAFSIPASFTLSSDYLSWTASIWFHDGIQTCIESKRHFCFKLTQTQCWGTSLLGRVRALGLTHSVVWHCRFFLFFKSMQGVHSPASDCSFGVLLNHPKISVWVKASTSCGSWHPERSHSRWFIGPPVWAPKQ